MLDKRSPVAERLARKAASQYGIVDRADLAELGVPRSTVSYWARSGRLHRLHRGVYAIAPPALLADESRWLAAVRACGEDAVLSHASAGQLLWMLSRTERHALHVAVPGRPRRKPVGVIVHRPVELPLVDRTVRAGIPVTTPTRTVWDLAAVLPPRSVQRAFERARAADQLDLDRLRCLLDAAPRRRGAGLIRELLASRPLPLAEVRSWLEALLLHVCSENGLPVPAVNVPLLGWEVDFLWQRERFVVEADGRQHLTPRQRDRDNRRDIELARAGFLVRRYSEQAMRGEAAVASEVSEILTERRRR